MSLRAWCGFWGGGSWGNAQGVVCERWDPEQAPCCNCPFLCLHALEGMLLFGGHGPLCVYVFSCSVMSHLCDPVGCSPPLCPWDFPRQEYWSGLQFPFPGDLPDPGIKPASLAYLADSLTLSHQGSHFCLSCLQIPYCLAHSWRICEMIHFGSLFLV